MTMKPIEERGRMSRSRQNIREGAGIAIWAALLKRRNTPDNHRSPGRSTAETSDDSILRTEYPMHVVLCGSCVEMKWKTFWRGEIRIWTALYSSIDLALSLAILISSTNSYCKVFDAVSLASACCTSSNLRLDFCLPRWDHILRDKKINLGNFSSEQLFFLFLLLAIWRIWSLTGCPQFVLRCSPFEMIGMHMMD
jgi:hypothetical protein